ncbi:glycosyltransferase family 4 protein [Geminocystis sp. NIES-3709]|uniref:glycosyltransferase family 4 protein n=1 Tax=Geminocystis sp. NIES-3709 TaxID=1617448 RepID=UPI0005FC7174|nr:glycosyltransferase family 4 protein [Geminocystis sp. NIES-3709]BAQ65348.1 glycosyltransferase [Geminocystis sp. NIES-3709]
MMINYYNSDDQYHILILNQFFPPDYAPTGQLIEELAIALSEKGMKVRVFSGQPAYAFDTKEAPRDEIIKGVNIKRTRSSRVWPDRIRGKAVNSILFFIRAFFHLIRYQKTDDLLIITTAPAFMTWLGFFAHLIWRKKYICIIYDLYPNILYQLKVLPKNHAIVKLWGILNHHTWINAQEIIVLSDSMKKRIIESCPSIKHKITVVHNWADGNMIKPLNKEDNWFAQQYGLHTKFTIIYSGNMGRCHDMDTIISAAYLLTEYQDNFQFLFIGSGAQQKPLKDKMDKLGLKNVLFLPYQKKEILPYSLTACDISLISIAEDMDGVVAPSKLYSTLAAGNVVGVICPETSFLTQLVVKAQCGESFRNGDAEGLANFFLNLYHNKKLCEKMGYNARQYFCNNFSKNIAVDKYMEIIEGIRYESKKYPHR